jgi:catechol 2,3-dioxygenase-like lactoylglutathione lyase family enzyme
MRITDVTANLRVDDRDAAQDFFTGFLGLSDVEFDLGWVASLSVPGTRVRVHLITGDETAAVESDISVHTPDVDAAYAEARERGYEIVHPLTTEAWGVRRFFVRAPGGDIVVNVVQHTD